MMSKTLTIPVIRALERTLKSRLDRKMCIKLCFKRLNIIRDIRKLLYSYMNNVFEDEARLGLAYKVHYEWKLWANEILL